MLRKKMQPLNIIEHETSLLLIDEHDKKEKCRNWRSQHIVHFHRNSIEIQEWEDTISNFVNENFVINDINVLL